MFREGVPIRCTLGVRSKRPELRKEEWRKPLTDVNNKEKRSQKPGRDETGLGMRWYTQ